MERVIATYEAGWSGFWLARWLATHEVETYVVQPSSVLVDRRARRAKSDGIDAELLLRTLLAWLRGEPRVCSMVPIPAEADEDARRSVRERTELVAERVALVSRIGAVLATMGCGDYNPLLQNRRQRLVNYAPRLGRRCRRTLLPRSSACSIGWIWCARSSPRWSRTATRYSKKMRRTDVRLAGKARRLMTAIDPPVRMTTGLSTGANYGRFYPGYTRPTNRWIVRRGHSSNRTLGRQAGLLPRAAWSWISRCPIRPCRAMPARYRPLGG